MKEFNHQTYNLMKSYYKEQFKNSDYSEVLEFIAEKLDLDADQYAMLEAGLHRVNNNTIEYCRAALIGELPDDFNQWNFFKEYEL